MYEVPMIDDKVYTLLKVYECGSFVAASKELNITQPAVGHQFKAYYQPKCNPKTGEIVGGEGARNPNNIVLSGYICKPPVYRTTPFAREIADVLIAVNRAYNKSDYIPCIAWGRNARFVKNLGVGEKIAVSGRIQSREYVKKISETESRTMIAYEVSICRLAAYENADAFDLDTEFDSNFIPSTALADSV